MNSIRLAFEYKCGIMTLVIINKEDYRHYWTIYIE